MSDQTHTIRPPPLGHARHMTEAEVDAAIKHTCDSIEALAQTLQAEARWADLAKLGTRASECGRHCRDRIARWQGGGVVYPTVEE